MPSPFALRSRLVFPIDRPPIDGGVVTIAGERIVAVGTHAADGATVCDLGDSALMPGLVNAHAHLEFSDLAQPLGRPGISFADWIRLVIDRRGCRNRSSTQAIASGLEESIRCGVTTVGEIATVSLQAYSTNNPAPALHAFHEVIGFSRARADSAFEAFEKRLDEFETADSPVDSDQFSPPLHGISPHAPYTVNPVLLDRLIALARKCGMPVAMHLAETNEELQFLRDGTGPLRDLLEERSMWDSTAVTRQTRPIEYLEQLAGAPRAVVVHGNYLTDNELAFLAGRRDRMSLVYCPRTHAFFQHTPYPLKKAIEAGVRVALGTDSRASNPDLCLLSEMRTILTGHPDVSPTDILRMGTRWAAEALGIGESAGTLTPGKLADIIAVPIGQPVSHVGPTSILENDTPASAVWIRGKRTTPGRE